jgi:hemoglobin
VPIEPADLPPRPEEFPVTIYDAIGGPTAVAAAVDDFYARVLADPSLAPFFTDIDLSRLRSHQRAFIAAAIGGPEIYAGRDMGAAHAGLGITDADFDAVVGHLVDTLASLGVPGETIAEIGGRLAPLRSSIVTREPAVPN